jgi:hypothetical protein
MVRAGLGVLAVIRGHGNKLIVVVARFALIPD